MRRFFLFFCTVSFIGCTEYTTQVGGPESAQTLLSGGHPIVPQVQLLTFKNTIGPLRVTGGETDTNVLFRLFRQVTNPTGTAPTTQLSAIQMAVDLRSDSLHFFVIYPLNEPRYRYAAETTFLTPYRIACLVDSVQQIATVTDLGAPLIVRNVYGANVLRHAGNCSISSLGGSVYAEVAIPPGGSCIVNVVSGDITLKVPGNTSANVTARTSSGTVSTSGLNFETRTQQQTSLVGRLGNGNGEIRLETLRGNIALELWSQ